MIELSFIIYQAVIAFRIFMEMEELTTSIFTHQLFWFNSVLLFFLISFKYILKIETKRLWILSAGGMLAFIPIIYAKFLGVTWRLNYIEPVSIKQIFFDLLTLLYNHSHNWLMFPELIALFICSFALGIFLSKKVKLSFIASAVALYSSFLALGFSWLAVNPEHPTLFLVNSGMEDSLFYAMQLITYFSILAIAGFYKNLGELFNKFSNPLFFLILFLSSAFLLQFTYLSIFVKEKTVFDFFVTFLPSCSLVLTGLLAALTLLKLEPRKSLFLPSWVAFFSIICAFF
ncbi:MAG: hypothetical protein ACOX2F_10590 [bacterium]